MLWEPQTVEGEAIGSIPYDSLRMFLPLLATGRLCRAQPDRKVLRIVAFTFHLRVPYAAQEERH